jgi:hypothetical protein
MILFGVKVLKSIRQVGILSLALAISALTAQAQVPFSSTVNISNNAGNSQIPQIAVDSKGNIYVVWLDNSSGNNSVLFSRSSDGGATFSSPLSLSNNPGGSALFPQVAIDPTTGNIYAAWFDSNSGNPGIFFRHSTDGGATFSAPINGPAVTGPVVLAVDPSGRILLAWSSNNSAGAARFVFSRSLDAGTTFTAPLPISNNAPAGNQAFMTLDSSGNILVAWTEASPNNIFFSRSTDGGATFSAPTNVTNVSGTITVGLYGLAVDAAGNIHVLWTSAFGGQFQTQVSRSSDNGATFAAENFQSTVSDSSQSPQMALDPKGGINIVWNTDQGNPTIQFSRSADGGATFSTQAIEADNFANPGPATIATDTNGNINILWSQSGSPTAAGGIIFTRSTDSGQTFSAHQQVSTNQGNDLKVALDGSGNIYAVWSQVMPTRNGDIFFSLGTPTSSSGSSLSLSSLSLSATSVTGGSSSAGVVTLSGPAPAGGVSVFLSSSDPAVASVAASVTVPEGANSATFAVTTTPVSTSTSVTISASFSGGTVSAPLLVLPPVLASVTLSPSRVTGGRSSVATVTLSGPAPAGGVMVSLASSNSLAAMVPSSVVVAAGSATASFKISTLPVLFPTDVTISANFAGVTQTADLKILPLIILGKSGPVVGVGLSLK